MVPKIMKQGTLTPWLYLSAALLIMLVFIVYPTVNTVMLSLRDKTGTQSAAVDCVPGEACWGTFDNYRYALTDSDMTQALRNNALWLLLMVPGTVAAGLLFAVLATVTGSIFARIMWGAYWNWDPRQTSIVILLLIYGAYLGLRGAIPDPERRATLAAVYAILAFVTVPFLVFVVPRIYWSLHPDTIINTRGSNEFDPLYTQVLLASLAGFTGLFVWLYTIGCRVEDLRQRRRHEVL